MSGETAQDSSVGACLLARALALILMQEGFCRAWLSLLRVMSELLEQEGLSLFRSHEDAHALANALVAKGEEEGDPWRMPCADLARQIRACFGQCPSASDDEAFGTSFAELCRKYPGVRR